MNQHGPQIFGLNLTNLSNWLIVFAVIWFLGSIGLGWLVNSILVIMALVIATPLVAYVALRWWLNRNLIAENCPVCAYQITALNQTQVQCPNCGEPLKVENGHLTRLTPPGTIDVTAVEVSVSQLED